MTVIECVWHCVDVRLDQQGLFRVQLSYFRGSMERAIEIEFFVGGSIGLSMPISTSGAGEAATMVVEDK